MFGSSTYDFRLATEDDADTLRRLAELDSRAPLAGRVLIGQIAGCPAAALSLADDRVIADPFRRTDHLVACLRSRAGAMRAYEATPSLSERMRTALRTHAPSDGTRPTGDRDAHPAEMRTTSSRRRPRLRLRRSNPADGTGLMARWAPER